MASNVRRLFEQFQPEHYGVAFDIDAEAMTFRGTVMIRGKKVGRPAQRLTFHQKDLNITAATIIKNDKKGPQTIVVDRINNQATYDEVRLHASSMVYPGDYTITMEFNGDITRPMNGIYPCFFEDDGHAKKLIATQFESHHAREALPCIDEPEAKANFDLTLVTNAACSKVVIANTPVKEQQTSADKVVTTFETTPRMSTYLLAFAFGDLDSQEATTKDGVLVRTFATPANVRYTAFALDCAVKTLEFYNNYFDIPYPLAKCDLVALPDFASGAMENWGLITFREQALLNDPQNTSLHVKQYIANVVAHELTHQWFGNLVTMKWWNDLWLNESFASWMSYLAVDHLFPDWQVWTQFVVEEQVPAMKLDSLENTHPIEVAINHPDEIRTIFDAISYEKGASVLNMLHNYLGADDFRDGLRLYLKKHAYSNTVSTDLWGAWEAASGKPIQEFMGAWTSLSGYPIVHVGVTDTSVHLQQTRFYLSPDAKKTREIWPIPLLASSPTLGVEAFDVVERTILVDNEPSGLIVNHGRAAFFRAVYDPEHLELLAKNVSGGKLNEVDRLGLLSDSFEAAKAGYGSTTDALQLLEAYRNEDSTVVWEVIAGAIGSIKMVMNDDDLREAMKPYIRQLTAKQLERLGWEERASDSHFDRLLRPTILGLAANADEPEVVAEALKRFETMKVPQDLAPDLRGIIYGTAARLGGQKEFSKLLKLHNTSTNSEERVTLCAALTGFEKQPQIDQALAMIDTDDVRLQDAMFWIAYSFMNRFARDKTWQWLKDHWQWLKENMGSDLSFYRMPLYAGRVQSDLAFLPEFEAFFAKHMSPAFERPIKQAVETIQWQADWKQRDLNPTKDYFKK